MLTGGFRRDVRPLALDVFLDGGDFGVIEGREVDRCPFLREGIQRVVVAGVEVGCLALHVEELGRAMRVVDAEQLFGVGVVLVQVRKQAIEKVAARHQAGFAQALVMQQQILVVALVDGLGGIVQPLSVSGVLGIKSRAGFFFKLGDALLLEAAQARFEHHQREERHHVGGPFAFLDARAAQRVCGIPDFSGVFEQSRSNFLCHSAFVLTLAKLIQR